MPSRDDPLTGRCACGAVRFQVVEPFRSAGYCHCHRCRRRSGVPWTFNGTAAGTSSADDGLERFAEGRPIRP